MGRPRKVILENKEEGLTDASVEARKPSEEVVKITTSFYAVKEGAKTEIVLKGEGKGFDEAITNLKFPKGIVALIRTTIERGEREVSVSLAPHIAQGILVQKNIVLLRKYFGL